MFSERSPQAERKVRKRKKKKCKEAIGLVEIIICIPGQTQGGGGSGKSVDCLDLIIHTSSKPFVTKYLKKFAESCERNLKEERTHGDWKTNRILQVV
jgi:hypothetical protein